MKQTIVLITTAVLISFLYLTPKLSPAFAGFVNAQQTGPTLTITAQLTPDNCLGTRGDFTLAYLQLTTIGGNEQGAAVDLTPANISATLNGQAIAGSKVIPEKFNFGGIATIELHAQPQLNYPKTSTLNVTVTGAKIRLNAEFGVSVKAVQPNDINACYYVSNEHGQYFKFNPAAPQSAPSASSNTSPAQLPPTNKLQPTPSPTPPLPQDAPENQQLPLTPSIQLEAQIGFITKILNLITIFFKKLFQLKT